MKRAICHEAGHAVVALYMGFFVERIKVSNGLPMLICNLDSPQKTKGESCTVLAGGIASEKMLFGNFDHEASQSDRRKCSEWGGGDLEDYVPEATRIIQMNKTRWCQFRKRLTVSWVKEADAAKFDSDPDSFELLSREQIMEIWEMPENTD